MIPYYNENPRYSFPIVNLLLILLNIGIFVAMFFLTDQAQILDRWAFVPTRFWSWNISSFPTVISYAFLHGGWGHLLSNMLFLWIFGHNVEDVLGHTKYFLFYILAAVWGVLLHAVMNHGDSHYLVGASGAISGVLTLYMFLFPRERIRILVLFFIPMKLAAILFIFFWIATQVYMGFSSISADSTMTQVAYFAHIGGIAYGILYAVFNAGRLKKKWKEKINQVKG